MCMTYMIRTQILLPKSLKDKIQHIAQKEQKTAAEVHRELLEEGINKRQINAGDALLKIADRAFKGAPKNLSENIDSLLYDHDR